MASFVGDGWTREGFIAAALPEDSGERLYEALSFTYRAAPRLEVVGHDSDVAIALKNVDIDRNCAVNAEKIACAFVAKHVSAWTLKDVEIHPIAVSEAACAGMNSRLFTKLYQIIRGERCSDKKPEATEPPKSDAEQLKN